MVVLVEHRWRFLVDLVASRSARAIPFSKKDTYGFDTPLGRHPGGLTQCSFDSVPRSGATGSDKARVVSFVDAWLFKGAPVGVYGDATSSPRFWYPNFGANQRDRFLCGLAKRAGSTRKIEQQHPQPQAHPLGGPG